MATKQPRTASTQSSFARLTDLFKPHRNEATIRFRNSWLGILSLVVITYILPLPSLWTAIAVVAFTGSDMAWWWYLCAAELSFLGLIALNMLQATYAIKYPRAPLPPLPSPARPKGITSPPVKRRFKPLSPNTSPQPQKSFSSSYASSPISTPSRVLNYTVPSPSPRFNLSLNSSGSLPPSPSPILSAYRGKHLISVGHALDGALLSRLAAEDSDTDD